MRRLMESLRFMLNGHGKRRSRRHSVRACRLRVRLSVREFEDRVLMSANASGVLSGVVFADINGTGIKTSLESGIPGVTLTLTGHTIYKDTAVDVTATTDSNGDFSFLNVQPGTYKLSASDTLNEFFGDNATVAGVSTPLGVSISGLSIAGGQSASQNFSVGGLRPEYVSLREFLSSTTNADFPFGSGGAGQGLASSRANSAPVVKTPIANMTVGLNSSSTMIDLAGHFSDPDLGTSQVQFNTTDGPIDVTLYDATAPQTVANFYDYINSGAYANTIFHRLVDGFVLQGGGFQFSTSGTTGELTPLTALPAVPNEFGASNLEGTLAMAKVGGDPNSATDQFFFNLGDNSSNLDNQNGGFTVFGKIDSAADQAVINQLVASAQLVTETNTTNPALNFTDSPADFPVVSGRYSGNDVNFPSDATASDFLMLNSVSIINRPESLTYTLVSNSNPTLVTPTLSDERLSLAYASGQFGTSTITVKATDDFGATVEDTFTVTVEPIAITSATSPVNISNVSNASVSGVTIANSPVSLVVSEGSQQLTALTTTADGSGNWSFSGVDLSSLPDGTITYTASTVVNGDTSSITETATKDTVAPTVAITTATNPIIISNDTSAAASGTGDANDQISVVVGDGTNSTTAQTTTVSSTGTWSVTGIDTTSLADGTVTYSVTETDAVGNTTTVTQSATKDTVAPVVGITSATNPINASNDTNTSVSGTADPGDSITVVASNGTSQSATASATAASDGTWSISGLDVSSLPDGTITYTATATDSAGNEGTITSTATKGTVVPKIVISSAPNPVNAAGQTAVVVSGTAENGVAVTVNATDGTVITPTQSTTASTTDGSWTETLDVSTLADGPITITATALDTSGNTNQTTRVVTKNTAAPSIGVQTVTTPVTSANANDTTVAGTASAGATISVVATDGTTSTVALTTTAASDGTWSISGIDVSSLADGTLTYTATATNSVGNTAADSITTTKTP